MHLQYYTYFFHSLPNRHDRTFTNQDTYRKPQDSRHHRSSIHKNTGGTPWIIHTRLLENTWSFPFSMEVCIGQETFPGDWRQASSPGGKLRKKSTRRPLTAPSPTPLSAPVSIELLISTRGSTLRRAQCRLLVSSRAAYHCSAICLPIALRVVVSGSDRIGQGELKDMSACFMFSSCSYC